MRSRPGSFAEREAAIDGARRHRRRSASPPILQALRDGDLYVRKSDGKVVVVDRRPAATSR